VNGVGSQRGHVFISYAQEDGAQRVSVLQRTLEAAGISVWRDTNKLWPGDEWRTIVRKAIREEELVFIACFSRESVARRRGFHNEELALAIEELRTRRPDEPWLIPVRLDACDIPDLDLGGGRTLGSIHRVDLFGEDASVETAKLLTAVHRILGSQVVHTGFPSGGWDAPSPIPEHEPPRGGLGAEETPQRVPPPPWPPQSPEILPPPVDWVKRIAITLAVAAVIGLIAAIVLIVHALTSRPSTSRPPKTPPASSVKMTVPHGCPAQFGGPGNKQLIGFVDSSCFPVGSDMANVAAAIEAQNASVLRSRTPYRTVVFFGVMSNSTGQGINPASLFQLRGVLYAQQRQNQGNPKFRVRVLLANAADQFQAGPTVASLIGARVRKDPSIVAALGIGQSRTFALDAVQTLGGMNLPVIGTSVTGEQMMDDANFFRVSPGDQRQAQLAATFAKRTLKAQKVLILVNQNKYIVGKNLDLYSEDLADQFGHYFSDASHKIMDVCYYGEQEIPNPSVICPGSNKSQSIAQLRARICQERPDLIFFAARAVTLPQLFTTPGGKCSHLPTVLGSSDVPKYANTSALRKAIPKFGSRLYYLSFAPAKLGGCFTTAHRSFQTEPMCEFLSRYRATYSNSSGSQSAADNDAGLSYDSSDAMLGYDALQTIIQVIDVTGDPGINGAGVLRELNSGQIAFNGASGRISFSAQDHSSPYHPVYVTLLGGTLTLQKSCGQFSHSAATEEGSYCPSVP
jgi:ABC-type branched-subunit amino acid transport system substrate-binding protein